MKSNHKTIVRIIVLALVVIGCAVGAEHFFGDMLSYQQLSETLHESGPLGVGLFLGAAVVGTALHLPAYVFLAICFLVYDGISGLFIGLATVVTVFTFHFLFGKMIGDKPLQYIKHPFILKTLHRLEESPLKSVILLRLMFFMSPPVSLILGVTSLRYRHFIFGSLIGVTLQLTALFTLVHFSRDTVTGWLK